MNGCVVAEKTLVSYKRDDKPCTYIHTYLLRNWLLMVRLQAPGCLSHWCFSRWYSPSARDESSLILSSEPQISVRRSEAVWCFPCFLWSREAKSSSAYCVSLYNSLKRTRRDTGVLQGLTINAAMPCRLRLRYPSGSLIPESDPAGGEAGLLKYLLPC